MDLNLIPRANVDIFIHRFAAFGPAYARLIELSEASLGLPIQSHSQLEVACITLAQDSYEDFHEVMHLASFGFSRGAFKILRTLYERGITHATLAYAKNAEERAERFTDFQWLNWHTIRSRSVEVIGEAQTRARLTPTFYDRIGREATRVEPAFTTHSVHTCSACGATKPNKKLARHWDKPVGRQAELLGERWQLPYFMAYSIPNVLIHTTGFSAGGASEAELPAVGAMFVLISIIRAQNYLFELNLYDEIGRYERDAADLNAQLAQTRLATRGE